MREIVRQVQSARKSAKLNVDDRIKLAVSCSDSEVVEAIERYDETIRMETLATELSKSPVDGYGTEASIDGHEIRISLTKV